MTVDIDIDDLTSAYCTDTIKSMALLYENNLYGQFLILFYASIDSMGLLNAPSKETSATRESFKSWVTKYLKPEPNINFNEIDLWAARCSILHAFTSESRLSNNGAAKQLQYYSGDKDSEKAKSFVNKVAALNDGAHLPVHIEDTYAAYMNGIKKFIIDLSIACKNNSDCEQRVRKLIQKHRV